MSFVVLSFQCNKNVQNIDLRGQNVLKEKQTWDWVELIFMETFISLASITLNCRMKGFG